LEADTNPKKTNDWTRAARSLQSRINQEAAKVVKTTKPKKPEKSPIPSGIEEATLRLGERAFYQSFPAIANNPQARPEERGERKPS